jgi:hypothetical protein
MNGESQGTPRSSLVCGSTIICSSDIIEVCTKSFKVCVTLRASMSLGKHHLQYLDTEMRNAFPAQTTLWRRTWLVVLYFHTPKAESMCSHHL